MKKLYILIFLVIVLITAFLIKQHNTNKIKNEEGTYELSSKDIKEYTYDINYIDKYRSEIINEDNKSIEYSLSFEESSIYGRVYIENEILYISDESKNIVYNVNENIKFISLLNVVDIDANEINIVALSKEKDVYLLQLYEEDISKISVKKLDLPSKVLNFTKLKLKAFNENGYTSVVYCENGKMYDVFSNIEYNENILLISNQYVIYEDEVLTTYDKKVLLNSDEEEYKVKSIVELYPDSNYFDNYAEFIIITKDNKLLMLCSNSVSEYTSMVMKITKIDEDKFEILFNNKEKITVNGVYDIDLYPLQFD